MIHHRTGWEKQTDKKTHNALDMRITQTAIWVNGITLCHVAESCDYNNYKEPISVVS